MPIKLVKVQVSVASTSGGAGTANFYRFLAPRGLYKGDITTGTDIAELADDDANIDEPIYTVAELIKARKIVRITVRTVEGTGTSAITRTMQMFCGIKKIGSVDDNLKNKTVTVDGALVSGSKIKSVVGKRDATFY